MPEFMANFARPFPAVKQMMHISLRYLSDQSIPSVPCLVIIIIKIFRRFSEAGAQASLAASIETCGKL